MELVGEGSWSEWDLLVAWIGFGAACWVLFALFMKRVLGREGMSCRGMKRVGLLTFILMAILGVLSITIVVTSAIPYLESFLEPDSPDSEYGD